MIVAVIDYGSGNLRSVAKALTRAASEAGGKDQIVVTSDAGQLRQADRIVLPGVGAFADCKRGLDSLPGVRQVLREQIIEGGRPFLGICVGMQLLADWGREHGDHAGLGWLPGEVVPLTPADPDLKIPHMGWNQLTATQPHFLLRNIAPDAHAYFVHSYHFRLTDHGHLFAEAEYGGKVAALVGRDNLIGTQFHPEKSQTVGLQVITNFLAWRP